MVPSLRGERGTGGMAWRTGSLHLLLLFVNAQGQDCSAPCKEHCGTFGKTLEGSGGDIVNVAFGRSAAQSSNVKRGRQACLGVNGRTLADFYGETGKEAFYQNCIMTDFTLPHGLTHWWWVDLGRQYTITNITLYRHEKDPETVLEGVRLIVENQTSNETCYTFFNTNGSMEVPAKRDIACSSPLTGRKIWLKAVTRSQSYFGVRMCELQVWACRPGLYGQNCAHTCSVYCPDSCNNYDGACPEGKPAFLWLGLASNSSSDTEELGVAENGSVTLTCAGTAAAVMTLHRNGRMTSPVASGPSPLNLTLDPARCQDAGAYVCLHSNAVGPTESPATRQVLVRCPPGSRSNQLPELHYSTDPSSITFEVTANPPPYPPFVFTYLGPPGESGSGEEKEGGGEGKVGAATATDPAPSSPSDAITLTAWCGARTSARLHSQLTCTVTVLQMTSGRAAGTYGVTLANSEGAQLYLFNVTYEEPRKAGGPGTLLLCLVASLAVAGIALMVVSWMTARVWRRNRTGEGQAQETTEPGNRRARKMEAVPRI